MRTLKIKMIIDLFMTLFLLMLMAYQITGEKLHEWFGAGMVVLFLIHNFLNIRWYGSLLKGKYTSLRILRTVINFSVLAAMLALAYSGIVMSRHVFSFLPVNGGMATARVMHLAGSYWGFVLMSVHLGLHWGIVIGMFRRFSGGKKAVAFACIFRLIAAMIAGYGAVCFYRADILSYMFLQADFVFLDYEKSPVSVFTEYMAMMGLWVFISYYVSKALGRLSASKSKRKEKGSVETEVVSDTDASGQDGQEDELNHTASEPSGNFVLITGGTFEMGSPDAEAWRSEDETQHTVTVSDFYMSMYEVTQAEYTEVMEDNSSSFSGDMLPVETVSWLDAIRYCNTRSEMEGLIPAYSIEGQTVTWDRSADGYRLPAEAEWEYVCRAGTITPFNTKTSISAEEIQSQTGADLFEITLVNPYSTDYNTVLDEAQRDQNEQARPELASHVENMEEYDMILLGYPNWWASIPMPVASFHEEYDFSGKTIIPFCSHGGGRFGQSLTAIAKLAPDAIMGEALSVHYSGGSSLPDDVTEWLVTNGILK